MALADHEMLMELKGYAPQLPPRPIRSAKHMLLTQAIMDAVEGMNDHDAALTVLAAVVASVKVDAINDPQNRNALLIIASRAVQISDMFDESVLAGSVDPLKVWRDGKQ